MAFYQSNLSTEGLEGVCTITHRMLKALILQAEQE